MERGRETWDVAVACDIRLGEAFKSIPDLWGAELEINHEAIQETLAQLPGYEPQSLPLLLTVMHEESMQATDIMGYFYASRRGKHVYVSKPDELRIGVSLGNLSKDTDDDHEGVMAKLQQLHLKAVSASTQTINQLVSDIINSAQAKPGSSLLITEEVAEIAKAARIGRRSARSLGCFIMPEAQTTPVCLSDEEIIMSPGCPVFTNKQLQETVTHELQHAVDRLNPGKADTWKQRKLLARLFGWRVGVVIGAYGSAQTTYEKMEHMAFGTLHTIPNLVSSIGGTALSIVLAGALGNRLAQTKNVEDKYYEESIWEQRAEEAEALAETLPTMIRLTRMGQILETPVCVRQ